jgi:hypothetical protein
MLMRWIRYDFDLISCRYVHVHVLFVASMLAFVCAKWPGGIVNCYSKACDPRLQVSVPFYFIVQMNGDNRSEKKPIKLSRMSAYYGHI